jgi:hypothetical protein
MVDIEGLNKVDVCLHDAEAKAFFKGLVVLLAVASFV